MLLVAGENHESVFIPSVLQISSHFFRLNKETHYVQYCHCCGIGLYFSQNVQAIHCTHIGPRAKTDCQVPVQAKFEYVQSFLRSL